MTAQNGESDKRTIADPSKPGRGHSSVAASSSTPISANTGREALLCDSSSEVSDEGYKSSQGGGSNSFLTNKDKLLLGHGVEFKDKSSASKDSLSLIHISEPTRLLRI